MAWRPSPQEGQQRVVANGHSSSWEVIKSGVQQGSVHGPLSFLISIKLSGGLSFTCKIYADDPSLFFLVHDKYVSDDELNSDLKIIGLKMIWLFNGKWNPIQIQINTLQKFISQIELIKIVLFL